MTWSVVRFELLIVVVLTLSAALLAVVAATRQRLAVTGRWTVPAVLAGVAIVDLTVPSFTYASHRTHRAILGLLAVTALVAAVAWVAAGRWRRLAPWIAGAGYLAAGAWVIRADPSPRIDVWVILQQASDGLGHGANAYATTWQHSPGVSDAFPYLPWTLALLAPGRWLAGDVRWALMAWTIVGALAVLALGRWRSPAAWAAAALLLLTPGTSTQVEQAWTEPLLFALLALWALLVDRGRAWWAVLPLALALASKQHLALLLPLLALWPAFGWRRTAAATGLAAALMAPWFVASPRDFWHDTVTELLHFWPILTSNTLYLAALRELHRRPPFWLVGLAVAVVVALAAVLVRRQRPDLGQLLRWCALVLFAANLVNKQAFYNQFWLVAALVLMSVAVPTGDESLPGEGLQIAQPGLGERLLRHAEHGVESRAGGGVR